MLLVLISTPAYGALEDKFASKNDLKTAIDGVVAGAPGALNTLQELAAALGNDSNYAATITKQLSGKADRANTLAGYGIADGASKSDLNSAINGVVSLMPPNLISNSHMTLLDENAIPAGFSVLGNGAVIKAVHPFTKGYEGPYLEMKPANATATSPANATQDNPYWYGKFYMGARSERGGLADGWGG
ncbi:hypothetical protein JFK97_20660 [Chromobacterium phragmitis]|nr:hypothetical protein [Chromobacterium amazonense]